MLKYTTQEVINKFTEYLKSGKPISPMNTEPCLKYLEAELKEKIEPEDVLWLFYHISI